MLELKLSNVGFSVIPFRADGSYALTPAGRPITSEGKSFKLLIQDDRENGSNMIIWLDLSYDDARLLGSMCPGGTLIDVVDGARAVKLAATLGKRKR